MKVISINLGNTGSTGNIARNIKKYARGKGIEVYTAYPASSIAGPKEDHDILIGHDKTRRVSRRLAVMTGLNGCFAQAATAKFLKQVKRIDPDIIHLHNLHHSYINLPMLFNFLKKSDIKVVWTLHDCWAFTGQCPHFILAKCDKWKTGCHDCPQINIYPEADVDRTKLMWKKKNEWFNGVRNLQLVTPSAWLADLTRQSFLKDYPVRVINNGIDTGRFRPAESDFKKKHGLEDKRIILGVAFGWGERKGYDVFLRLADTLPDDVKIILVGNAGTLPRNDRIIYIDRTHDQQELAELYTCADVLANPTREENYPTVNIEALACGTPVVTFRTGGSPEIPDERCGAVVEVDDFDSFREELLHVLNDHPFKKEDCISRANELSVNNMLSQYIDLYNSIGE